MTEPAWVSVIAGLLVFPVVEELAFREGLQRRLLGTFQVRWRVALSAAGFSAFHLLFASTVHAAATFLPGLALGAIRERRGLMAAVAVHSLFNAIYLAGVYLGLVPASLR